MEAATAAGLYAVETIVEAGVALAKGLSLSTAPLNATFTRMKAPSIPRSSHSVTVVGNRAYIFGGEISPREPVDNAMHCVTLPATSITEADYVSIPAKASHPGCDVPIARVGHTASAIDHNIYIFGGRGGKEMKALDEAGRVWVFNTHTSLWSYLDPPPNSSFAEARSYHASTATPYPPPPPTPSPIPSSIPEAPNAPTASAPATKTHEPPPENSYGTLIIHAGCLSSGGRTSDVWAFDISSRTWSPLPSAPEPARGGTSLALVRDRLYRFGGFDGTKEIGGEVDFLDLNIADEYNDKSGAGLMALSPRSGVSWRQNVFSPESHADGKGGNRTAPYDRSVLGLVPVTTGQGREYLLMICGEGEASKNGHDGVGRFFDDVWSFQLKSEGKTASAYKDATREVLLGKDTGEGSVVEVKYFAGEGCQQSVSGSAQSVGSKGEEEGKGLSLGDARGRLVQEGQTKPMGRRGWFAVSSMPDHASSVLLWGGVDEDNQRLGDGWVISVEL